MVFSTIIFLCVFLPITIMIYYCMPAACKNYFLLFASLLFYAWGEPRFVFVMLASILCNYGFGLLAAGIPYAYPMPKRRRWVIAAAVAVNLGILFVFKYLTFAMENLQRLIPGAPVWQIALPIGISFYTFQGLSYVIDVCREEGKLEEEGSWSEAREDCEKVSYVQRNPFRLALYISMFPQLIAGPIVRYKDIRNSLETRTHSLQQFARGADRFVIGLSKKAILANMTGQLADAILQGDYSVMGTGVAWLGALCYTLQIYFDFSGYSDMAIGLGRIFGFSFLENFNYPYISTSVREFWRRWHISLSGWFRDYLYIPLGGSRRGNVYLNLLIVFLATGLWHGAAWGFLFWGLWHGCFLLIERFVSCRKNKGRMSETREGKGVRGGGRAAGVPQPVTAAKKLLGWLYTMLVVMIGWVVFAIVDLRQAASYILIMFGKNAGGFHAYDIGYYLDHQMTFYLLIACLASVPWKVIIRQHFTGLYQVLFEEQNMFVYLLRKIGILGLLALSFMFVINSSYNPFIYFRF